MRQTKLICLLLISISSVYTDASVQETKDASAKSKREALLPDILQLIGKGQRQVNAYPTINQQYDRHGGYIYGGYNRPQYISNRPSYPQYPSYQRPSYSSYPNYQSYQSFPNPAYVGGGSLYPTTVQGGYAYSQTTPIQTSSAAQIQYVSAPQPQQYPIETPTPIQSTNIIKVPVPVPQPYPVTVEKKVPVQVPVYIRVPQQVRVEVPRPYPVTIEKKVPVPVQVPVYIKVPVQLPSENSGNPSKINIGGAQPPIGQALPNPGFIGNNANGWNNFNSDNSGYNPNINPGFTGTGTNIIGGSINPGINTGTTTILGDGYIPPPDCNQNGYNYNSPASDVTSASIGSIIPLNQSSTSSSSTIGIQPNNEYGPPTFYQGSASTNHDATTPEPVK